jgi:hypothetical protein
MVGIPAGTGPRDQLQTCRLGHRSARATPAASSAAAIPVGCSERRRQPAAAVHVQDWCTSGGFDRRRCPLLAVTPAGKAQSRPVATGGAAAPQSQSSQRPSAAARCTQSLGSTQRPTSPPTPDIRENYQPSWPFRAGTRARPSALTRHHHGWPHRSSVRRRGAVSPGIACVRASPPSCTHAIWRPKRLLFQPFRHPAGGTGWRWHCAVGPKCNGPSYDGGALST